MRDGLDAQAASDASISLLTKVRGPGVAGVISIDAKGNFGLARNTEMMPVSLCFSYREKPVAVVLPEEYGVIYPHEAVAGRKLRM